MTTLGDPGARGHGGCGAFTLVELLVAMAVLSVLVVVIFSLTSSTGRAISQSSAQIDAFATGRATFDLVTRRLSQSTLNTYYDYFDAQGRTPANPFYTNAAAGSNVFVPDHYGRQSDLQFLVRQNTQKPSYGQAVYYVVPQAYSNNSAQLATQGLLNASALYVRYGTDATFRPGYQNAGGGAGYLQPGQRFRYRLMQAIEPTESLQVFASVAAGNTNWINNLTDTGGGTSGGRWVAPLADNVVALVVWPRLSEYDDPTGTTLTANYAYDSRPAGGTAAVQAKTDNQLPPNLQITMVMISEAAARRLDTKSATPPAAVENALGGRFTAVANYQADLHALTDALTAAKIDYRVFSTSVPVRESRWSNVQ